MYPHQLPCQRAHSKDPAKKQPCLAQRLLEEEEDEAGLCAHGRAASWGWAGAAAGRAAQLRQGSVKLSSFNLPPRLYLVHCTLQGSNLPSA